MKYKNSRYKYYKNKSSQENKKAKISDDDLLDVNLLTLQMSIIPIIIYAYIISYTASKEALEIIYNKYNDDPKPNYSPDGLTLEGIYILFAVQIIFTNISIVRYNMLKRKKKMGQFKYSLKPNEYIIASNIISIISDIYLIAGAQGIYKRSKSQDIYGA